MPDTNWIPGLLVLGAGAVVGTLLLLRTRGTAPSPAAVDATGTDLERQRDALYTQIRDLDTNRGAMAPDDYRAERLRLVLDAARTLRALDGGESPAPAPVAPRAPSWGDRHPRLTGMLWGGGAVGFAAALFIGIQQDVKPKEEMGGGGGSAMSAASPSAPAMSAQQQQRMQGLVDAAKKAYDAAPGDLAAANDYTHVLLQAGEVMAAFEVTKTITADHPDDPEARTHQAIVLMQIGDMNMAEQLLDKVLVTDPAFGEALGYRGAIAYNAGEMPAAAAYWERAKAADPEMAGMLDPLIATAKAGGPPSSPGGPGMASASASRPPPGAAASAPTEKDVTGSVTVAAGVAAPSQGVVFIFARPTGVDAGPPAAVRRVPVATFPMDFRVGPNDSPMGGPFPDEMTLTVTVDHDGNPTVKEPEDLVGRAEHVKPGQSGLTITLAPRGP